MSSSHQLSTSQQNFLLCKQEEAPTGTELVAKASLIVCWLMRATAVQISDLIT